MTLTPSFKLLALDIDGTLVKEHTNTVSQPVRNAIHSLPASVTVCLVSARAWNDQKVILDQLEIPAGYHVLENGTKVINPRGELEYTKLLEHEQVVQIVEATQSICESVGFCVDGEWKQQLVDAQDQVTTLSLIAERSQAESIPNLLRTLPFQCVVTVGNHWSNPSLGVVLISHPDASKGGGLRYIQEKLQISPSETVAVGDGASDVPMMARAGEKVALGNAEQKLKDVATYIAPSVDDDGVVEVIHRFF